MSLIALIIVILYLALIGSLILGFDKVNEFTLKDVTPENRFSILIPFRMKLKIYLLYYNPFQN